MPTLAHFARAFAAMSLWVTTYGLVNSAAARTPLMHSQPSDIRAIQTADMPLARCGAILQHRFNRLQDEVPQDLCQYAGQVTLIVNTASYCGFTRQYKGLEALYAAHQKQGLVVLGFPSNDFGKQEPGSEKEIAELCYNTYGVKFPMFSKTFVIGPRANALYAALTQRTGQAPQWNFHKYLIDRKGQVVKSYASEIEPDNKTLLADIETALAERP